MTFEEALKLLKEGKKIRSPFFNDDEYLMGCYVGLNTELLGIPQEDFEEIKSHGMSIVKMKGDRQHPDMTPKHIFPDKHCSINPDLHRFPQINMLLIMRDDWEVVE